MTLNELKIGNSARITKVGGSGELRQHLLDMGMIPGAEVTLEKLAPMGDPMELVVHGYNLTLRLADAKTIEICDIPGKKVRMPSISASTEREHPGLGEGGRYHTKENEDPLPKGTKLTFALAGNQNCGKTTLFNALTGSNQHVGNFPGVTVEGKNGQIRGKPGTLVTDLPGIYSLSPYTAEELVSRQFILDEKPTGIINIVDATNIERNLYLTLQLLELDVPTVLALNMMDEVRGNGGSININLMEELLGIPVIPISAAKNEGVDELVRHAIHVAKYQEKPGRQDFCTKNGRFAPLHRALEGVMNLIYDHIEGSGIPIRFAASKVIEGDEIIISRLHLSDNEKDMIDHVILQMEEELHIDRAAAIADMRFSFISELCEATVIKPHESKEHIRSRKIDKLLTGKYTAIPSFIAIMALVFWLTFDLIGGNLQTLLESGIDLLSSRAVTLMESVDVNPIIRSLVIDGIITGVGSVLSFIPIIIVLFFFLSMLEDSGYMARIAFVTDKLLRKIGLSGRSIVPMLIGFGCTVPGVMASRTLPSERDRKMTVMLTPFMSCTAKLPIYAFFANAFFREYQTLVVLSLYILGIAVGILVALISKKTLFKGEPVPFVMELPNYRMPGAKNVMMLLWDKAKDFLHRAFTVIFIASIAVWALQTFDIHLNVAQETDKSILAMIAGFISPVFTASGFADYRIVTALIAGFMAKESVVSTIEVLFASTPLTSILSPIAAASLLVFCLLYTPCVAAISSVKRELGAKWAIGMVFLQCMIAWILSIAVYMIGGLII